MSDDLLNDLLCDGSLLSLRAFDEIERLRAERDALRALLELSRPYVGQADGLLADRIDAALKEQTT